MVSNSSSNTRFLENYRVVRRTEGWGSLDSTYYTRLPYVARDDPQHEIWRVRAATFRALVQIAGKNRRVLDLGAGNGWLAYQLARRGHSVAAVDLSDDNLDGLGARRHYPLSFEAYCADFLALPFANEQFDLVVLNASLHYAHDLASTVTESLRVLDRAGRIVVMDSPMYRDAASGRAMFAEKKRGFAEHMGLHVAGPEIGFLTFGDFANLARMASLEWQWIEPMVNVRWATRHWRARWRGRREPAHFGLMVGRRK